MSMSRYSSLNYYNANSYLKEGHYILRMWKLTKVLLPVYNMIIFREEGDATLLYLFFNNAA